jgi:hypothetical protein
VIGLILGTWNEPLVLGRGEWFCVGLTHAIVLGIAFFRWVIAPWLSRPR